MNKYVIDLKNQTIVKTESIELSPMEIKILSLLGNNQFIDAIDISKFLYNGYTSDDIGNIRAHIHRLKQKGFNIKAMPGAHRKYKLYEEVLFK